MAQIHCYIPDPIADEFRQKAEQAHLSVSKYLAKLVKQEVENGWPTGYFENLGRWDGGPLQRPSQGEYESREELD